MAFFAICFHTVNPLGSFRFSPFGWARLRMRPQCQKSLPEISCQLPSILPPKTQNKPQCPKEMATYTMLSRRKKPIDISTRQLRRSTEGLDHQQSLPRLHHPRNQYLQGGFPTSKLAHFYDADRQFPQQTPACEGRGKGNSSVNCKYTSSWRMQLTVSWHVSGSSIL